MKVKKFHDGNGLTAWQHYQLANLTFNYCLSSSFDGTASYSPSVETQTFYQWTNEKNSSSTSIFTLNLKSKVKSLKFNHVLTSDKVYENLTKNNLLDNKIATCLLKDGKYNLTTTVTSEKLIGQSVTETYSIDKTEFDATHNLKSVLSTKTEEFKTKVNEEIKSLNEGSEFNYSDDKFIESFGTETYYLNTINEIPAIINLEDGVSITVNQKLGSTNNSKNYTNISSNQLSGTSVSITNLNVSIDNPSFDITSTKGVNFANKSKYSIVSFNKGDVSTISVENNSDAMSANINEIDKIDPAVLSEEEFVKNQNITTTDNTEFIQNVLSGTYKNVVWSTVKNSFIIKNAIELNTSLGYCAKNDSEKRTLYYNGFTVNQNSLQGYSTDIISYTQNNSTYLKFEKDFYDIQQTIRLYFDKNLTIPLEIDEVDGALIEHTLNGKKIAVLNEDGSVKTDEKDGLITKRYYKHAKEFSYKNDIVYVAETFKDWFDADTYVDYGSLNSSANGKYVLTYNGKTPEYSSQYAILTGNTEIILTSNFKGTESNGTADKSEIIKNGDSYLVNYDDYNLSKFFYPASTNETTTKYKSFSFNFRIPTDGWNLLNDLQYAQNESQKLEEMSTGDFSEFTAQVTETSGERTFFEGTLVVRYRNLKETDQLNLTGYDRYTFKRQAIPFIATVTNKRRLC